MIGMFSLAAIALAAGLFAILVQMGATRRERTPVHNEQEQ